MSIIYTVIAREPNIILVEHTNAAGNFPVITQNILRRITPNTRLSYDYNKEYRYYLAISSIISMKGISHFYV